MRTILSLSSLLLLAACSTTRVTLPPRSATEQMLISEAAEAAAIAIHLQLPANTRAFLDTTNFEGVDAKYAVSAIRQSLLQQGAAFVDTKAECDVVVEVRAGALSIDSITQTIGIPKINLREINIPIDTPGLHIATRSKTVGIAKFSLFAYDHKTGRLIAVVAPVTGMSQRSQNAASIVTWTYARGSGVSS